MAQTISITRALTRIKTNKDQLNNLENEKYVVSELAVEVDSKRVKAFKANSQSNFDKAKSLVAESVALQQAIRKSNLETKVTIANEEMTVSEAIIRKDLASYQRDIFSTIRSQSMRADSQIEDADSKIEQKAREFVERLKTNEDNKDQLDRAFELGRQSAERELKRVKVAGFNVDSFLVEELDRLNQFLQEVDYVLSESNAVTMIEVDF